MVSKAKVIVALLFFTCATVLIGASTRYRFLERSKQGTLPRVTNKTNSIQISNVHHSSDGSTEITFLNRSTKPLYAYTIVTAEKPVRTYMTVLETSRPVGPGETKAEKIPDAAFGSSAATNGDSNEIVFSALYLEGGEMEGDSRDSGKLKLRLMGIKEQSNLALKILREANSSSEQDAERLLVSLESQVGSMSVPDEPAQPSTERENGRKSVTDQLLKEIKNVRKKANSTFEVKGQLADLVSYYQRLAEKL